MGAAAGACTGAYAGGVASADVGTTGMPSTARESLTGRSRARGIASTLANLRHALEREACVGPELQLERDLAELPERVLVGRLELEHLLVQGGGLRVKALDEEMIGPPRELPRGALALAGALEQVGQLLDQPPVDRREVRELLVLRDCLVHPSQAERSFGLAGQFLANAHQQPMSSSSIRRSNRVARRKLRRCASLNPCCRMAARCSAVA